MLPYAHVAESELHEAEVNLNLAELEYERSTQLLQQRTIRSPIDGVVVERTLGPGEYAYDQSHILTLSQIDPLKVEAFVPLSEYGKIAVGTATEIYPEESVGGKSDAKVRIVDRVFDSASGTIGIRLELPNPGFRIPAGLKCRVHFFGRHSIGRGRSSYG